MTVSPNTRPIHAHGPGAGHPFKGATLCGKLVRFGGLQAEGRPVTCKLCIKTLPLAMEFDSLRQLLQDRMGWDIYKADAWLKTENPHFGETAPIDLIRRGRAHKVRAFVEAATAGEFP